MAMSKSRRRTAFNHLNIVPTVVTLCVTAVLTSLVSLPWSTEASPTFLGGSIQACDFDLPRQKANCSHRGFTEVPVDLPGNIKILSLTYNNLTALWNHSFSRLPGLLDISLQFNHIRHIDPGTFAGLSDLQTVNLVNNLLRALPSHVFSHNFSIIYILLRNNLFESIPDLDIRGNIDLSTIDLANNTINSATFHMILPTNCRLLILDLSYNAIWHIAEGDFSSLRSCDEVHQVDLSANGLKSVETKSLDGLPVAGIRFDINPLYERGVREVFEAAALAPNLTYLNVGETILDTISKDLFIPLENSSVTKLALYTNNISTTSLPIDVFHHLPRIYSLSLVKNSIENIAPGPFQGMVSMGILHLESCSISKIFAPSEGERWNPPLTSLNLANNHIYEIPSKAFLGLDKLLYLILEYNSIQFIYEDSFYGLENLINLVLNNNNLISTLSTFVFAPLKNLNSLFISDSQINSLVPSKSLSGLPSLHELFLHNNPLRLSDIWDNSTGVSLFKGLRSLQTLDLSSTLISGEIPPQCFSGLTNILQLNLQGMKSIQTIHPDLLQDLTNLEVLSLDDNNIQDFPAGLFLNQANLTALYMSRNPVSNLDPHLFEHMTKLSQLTLSGTSVEVIPRRTFLPIVSSIRTLDVSRKSLSCNCDNKWLREWFKNGSASVILTGTVCTYDSPPELRGKPFTDFDPVLLCGPRIVLYTSIALISVALIVCLCVLYFNRWWVNYKCFLLKLCIVGYREVVDDMDYRFDINLVFHDKEEEWVDEQLLPNIKREMGTDVAICVGDDDLPLGMLRLDAVADVIDNSYKSVFVISRAAVTDGWFITKLRLALQHINHAQRDAVLLVFLEEIPDERLPYLVRLLLSVNRPYLQWTDDERYQEYFWNQFAKCARITTKIDVTLPV